MQISHWPLLALLPLALSGCLGGLVDPTLLGTCHTCRNTENDRDPAQDFNPNSSSARIVGGASKIADLDLLVASRSALSTIPNLSILHGTAHINEGALTQFDESRRADEPIINWHTNWDRFHTTDSLAMVGMFDGYRYAADGSLTYTNFAYGLGKMTVSLPTVAGTAFYSFIGSAAKYLDISNYDWLPRYRWSGELAVGWGMSPITKVGVDIHSSNLYGDYRLRSDGGTSNIGLSEISLTPGTATFASDSRNVSLISDGGSTIERVPVFGFFAGDAAERALLSFSSSSDFESNDVILFGLTTSGGGGGGDGGGGGSITPLDTSGSLRMVQVGPGGFTPLARNSLASATQDAAGVVTSYSPGAPDIYRIGTAQGVDAGSDALITWGRWVSGTTMLDGSGGGPITGNTIGPDQGFHYVIGQPTAALPASGTANFTLLGATSPTFADGAFPAGTLTSTGPVAMAVTWGGNPGTQIAMDLTATMPGDGVYRIRTIGGLAATSGMLSTSGSASFNGTVDVTRTGTARACGGSACLATVNGFFAGPNAERAGLVYQIAPAGGPSGAGTNINGAAVFAKQ